MVVIIGGGITGAATAFYLTKISGQNPPPITIIDAVVGGVGVGVGVGASSSVSGAGAFLAETWGDGTKTESLHRRSFQMHCDLAKELNLASFRELPAFEVDIEEESLEEGGEYIKKNSGKVVESLQCQLPWLSGVVHSPLPGRTAQVDPGELTGALMGYALDKGAKLVVGAVEGLDIDVSSDKNGSGSSGKQRNVMGVRLEGGGIIPVTDKIVFALGPWSCRLEDWLDTPTPIEGVWSTSLVFKTNKSSTVIDNLVADHPAALFCKEDSYGCHLEILPRPNGSLYVSGCGGSKILSPATLRANVPRPDQTNQPDISRSIAAENSLSLLLSSGSSSISGQQEQQPLSADNVRACIRPVSPDKAPIFGKINDFSNAFIATGGGPWGITWAPVIGLSIARLLKGDDPPINIRNFSTRRFDTPVYRTLLRQRGEQADKILMNQDNDE